MKQGQNRLYIEGNLLSTGIRKATSRSEDPILCLIKPDTIKFVALSEQLTISWEAQLPQPAQGHLVFLIPPLVAQLLSSEAVRSQVGVEVITHGEDVVARLIDHLGHYEICWKSDLTTFPAPPEFSDLIKVPKALIDVLYIKIADATHEAVAKLVHMEADEQIHRTKLAILIDLDFGRLCVDGQEIVGIESSRYYFDPRLVIRALECIRDRIVHVGVTPSKRGGRRAYLSLLATQDVWTVHCALLSIGRDTQMLYPLPPGRGR